MAHATGYGVLPDHHWWAEGRARVLEAVVSRLVPPGGSALDVGAGTGGWARRLAARFHPVSMVESDPGLQSRIVAGGGAGRVVGATLPGPLPFRDGAFALVCCLDVIEHVDDDRASVGELARLAAPGGHVLVTVPAHPHLWSRHDTAVGHRRRYTREALIARVEEAGLAVRLLSPLNVFLYPAAAVLRRLDVVGDALPRPGMNRALTAVFAAERHLVGRWPSFARGLSWICLARRC